MRTESYIKGEWVAAPQTFAVTDPYSGEEIAQVADLGAEECRRAIDAAHEAFPLWSGYTASKRSRILKAWYGLILENADRLAELLTREQGKPLAEAKGEVKYGASYLEWFAEEAKRAYGDVIPGHMGDKRITVIKQPVGVVGAITPWNFPSAMITRKVAPALAAGCTVVVKPAELTPLSALALAELAEEAGIPAAVFNVVCTSNPAPIGKELCENPKIKKLSFTGSTEVGKILLAQCAPSVKKVSMELGGNAPFIVFEDADVDAAVEGLMASKFRNAGQTCICSNRIFVHRSLMDEFGEKLSEAMKRLNWGSGMERGVNVGPLVEKAAVDFVGGLVEDALAQGGELMCGGKLAKGHRLIYEPTIIKGAKRNMRLFKEEIFGPLAPIYSFEEEQEVIDLANDTHYGLAAYFYGRDYARIWRVAEALEYGMVGINTGMIGTPVAPFGGVKQSGFGREGSKYGLDDYLNIKYMCWAGVS